MHNPCQTFPQRCRETKGDKLTCGRVAAWFSLSHCITMKAGDKFSAGSIGLQESASRLRSCEKTRSALEEHCYTLFLANPFKRHPLGGGMTVALNFGECHPPPEQAANHGERCHAALHGIALADEPQPRMSPVEHYILTDSNSLSLNLRTLPPPQKR